MVPSSANALSPPSASAPAADMAAPVLLIVDDIADNRAILARRFRKRGFETAEAESGRQALDMLAIRSFDVVLLDVMMPEMDGIAVLGRLRERASASELPVIMVTAKSQSEDIVAALALGANDYVTKPVEFEVALARVNTQVERKRAEMAARESADRLRLLNEELEARVSERTERLAAANRKLQSEISQRREIEAHNAHLARHDALTGLGNRLLLREHIARALEARDAGAGAPGLLVIDLDGFKSVNDGLGHPIGDAVLRHVADALKGLIRGGECVARLGGDEFAIMMLTGGSQEKGLEAAACRAGEVIAALSRPVTLDGHLVHNGACVGIAMAMPDWQAPEDLIKAADMALHRAKLEGRGLWRVFDPSMDASAQARRLLEQDLRNALSEGELALFYQPLVDLKTRRITGFEALMRWRHPDRGYVSPADFIPVAEDLGLIVSLGDWALREACREAVKWPPEIKIAVNLSPIQFQRGNLLSAVVGALATSGLAPERLELEITETVLLDRSTANLDTLKALRKLGVRIAMDDFGTGYSSLSYLRSFPFDKIKIDQSFIRDLAGNSESQAIVDAIAGLGTSFGITTTAEGVETQEQFDWLSLNGCNEVQGRLFSMPVPPEDLPGLFAAQAAPNRPAAPGV